MRDSGKSAESEGESLQKVFSCLLPSAYHVGSELGGNIEHVVSIEVEMSNIFCWSQKCGYRITQTQHKFVRIP